MKYLKNYKTFEQLDFEDELDSKLTNDVESTLVIHGINYEYINRDNDNDPDILESGSIKLKEDDKSKYYFFLENEHLFEFLKNQLENEPYDIKSDLWNTLDEDDKMDLFSEVKDDYLEEYYSDELDEIEEMDDNDIFYTYVDDDMVELLDQEDLINRLLLNVEVSEEYDLIAGILGYDMYKSKDDTHVLIIT